MGDRRPAATVEAYVTMPKLALSTQGVAMKSSRPTAVVEGISQSR